jgi:nucleotide-binding universal stress UspA family protein
MNRIGRILVAVDFSEASESALDLAWELTERLRASLTILHVLQSLPDRSRLELEIDARAELERLREPLGRADFQVELIVLSGDRPAETISAWARANGADLIIVGTRGRSGIGRAVMGSVAESIVREGPCPVLVTRA